MRNIFLTRKFCAKKVHQKHLIWNIVIVSRETVTHLIFIW